MVQELFPGVFKVKGQLATKNSAKGFRVYGEKLIQERGVEYRQWDPFRSKLAAAIQKGLKTLPIKPGASVLYLGASTGTTASHVADITGEVVYCIEYSKRMMRELMPVCERKQNMIPILGDAARPKTYATQAGPVDVVYQDVAQPNQAEILERNVRLFTASHAMLSIKARSIDSSKDPKQVFKEEIRELKEKFKVTEAIDLRPFEKDHVLVNLNVL